MNVYKEIIVEKVREVCRLHDELSKTSPPESPDLFETYLEKRSELLGFFEVPETAGVCNHFDSILKYPVNENDFEMLFQYLQTAAEEQAAFKSVDSEERLYEAIDAGTEPGEIIPRMGLRWTAYTEFVYWKVARDEHLKILRKDFNVFIGMEYLFKAEKLNDDVMALKQRTDEISQKRAPYLAEFLYESD